MLKQVQHDSFVIPNLFRNLLEYYNNFTVWISFVDVLTNLVALQSLNQSFDCSLVFITGFYSNDVYVWRRRTFNKKSVFLCTKTCWNSVVTIDYGSVYIRKNAWKRSSFNFNELKVQRI